MLQIILPIVLFLTSVFLILLVLVQRGRGGGLAGAFGGLGGQSAFGTKAGDLFTRITIVVATFWIILCAGSVLLLSDTGQGLISPEMGGAAAPAQPGALPPVDAVPAESGPGTTDAAPTTTTPQTTAPATTAPETEPSK